MGAVSSALSGALQLHSGGATVHSLLFARSASARPMSYASYVAGAVSGAATSRHCCGTLMTPSPATWSERAPSGPAGHGDSPPPSGCGCPKAEQQALPDRAHERFACHGPDYRGRCGYRPRTPCPGPASGASHWAGAATTRSSTMGQPGTTCGERRAACCCAECRNRASSSCFRHGGATAFTCCDARAPVLTRRRAVSCCEEHTRPESQMDTATEHPPAAETTPGRLRPAPAPRRGLTPAPGIGPTDQALRLGPWTRGVRPSLDTPSSARPRARRQPPLEQQIRARIIDATRARGEGGRTSRCPRRWRSSSTAAWTGPRIVARWTAAAMIASE